MSVVDETPFFSICIPAHNALPLIQETFVSVASQTFDNWEIVVVDDCSQDGLIDWLDKQEVVPKERLFVRRMAENKGPFYARRVAFRSARGLYVVCIDSDDEFIGAKALQRIYSTITSADVLPDVVMFNASLNREGNSLWIDYAEEGLTSGYNSKQKVIQAFLTTYKLNNLCLKAVKRDFLLPADLKNAQGLLMCEDRLEVAGILNKAESFILLDEPLYYYRQNSTSTTHRLFDLDYCRQQSYVEMSIHDMFSGNPHLSASSELFLVMWSDDMLRIARGRSLSRTVECYRSMCSDSYFLLSLKNSDLKGLRADKRALLHLLSRHSFAFAGVLAKMLNLMRALVKRNECCS